MFRSVRNATWARTRDLVLVASLQKPLMNANAGVSSKAGSFCFILSLHIRPCFLYVYRDWSGKSVHFVWVFITWQCDRYQSLLHWAWNYNASLNAGVGYIRKNNSQFWHFLFCTHTVNISRSSWGLSLIWLAYLLNFENDWHLLSAQWPCVLIYGVFCNHYQLLGM